MQKRGQSEQTVPGRAPSDRCSDGTGAPLDTTYPALRASPARAARSKPASASTADRRQQRDEQASIAEWLRQRQAEQQARFASLPLYLKSDDHVVFLHQVRLVANQAAHDAAMDLLRRLSRTGS